MLNLKAGAALLVTLILSVVAFVVAKQLLPDSTTIIVLLLPSIFCVLTTISLLVVSNIINAAPSTVTETPKSKPTASPKPVTGDIATLYVGNLAYKANEKLVQEHFEQVAAIKSVRLVKDKKTNRRKGFGFVEVSASDESKFISKMNDTEFMERNIIVRPANEKQH
ncbi:MAG: RNA-binding protein [Glaciecola sp.]